MNQVLGPLRRFGVCVREQPWSPSPFSATSAVGCRFLDARLFRKPHTNLTAEYAERRGEGKTTDWSNPYTPSWGRCCLYSPDLVNLCVLCDLCGWWLSFHGRSALPQAAHQSHRRVRRASRRGRLLTGASPIPPSGFGVAATEQPWSPSAFSATSAVRCCFLNARLFRKPHTVLTAEYAERRRDTDHQDREAPFAERSLSAVEPRHSAVCWTSAFSARSAVGCRFLDVRLADLTAESAERRRGTGTWD